VIKIGPDARIIVPVRQRNPNGLVRTRLGVAGGKRSH
jgi:hypothetical protein